MPHNSKKIRVTKVSELQEFYNLRDGWNGLLEASDMNNFFLRWEWLWQWWNVYGGKDCGLSILTVSRGDEMIGIAPFYLTRRQLFFSNVRRLLFLGTDDKNLLSEYMDIICKAGEEEAVTGAVMAYIAKEDLCDEVLLYKMRTFPGSLRVLEEKCRAAKFSFKISNTYESPYINLPKSYDEFLKNCGVSLRYQIRNNLKKLSRYGDAAFRRTRGPEDFEDDFRELVRLHQNRWRSRNMPGMFSEEKALAFQKGAMKTMLENGYLELSFLSISGRNVAALYNINYNGKIYFYQSGLDAFFDKNLSPGLLLHSRCIEDAIAGGLKEYDFLLMGDTDFYKKKWTKESRRMCDVYMSRLWLGRLLIPARDRIRKAIVATNIGR